MSPTDAETWDERALAAEAEVERLRAERDEVMAILRDEARIRHVTTPAAGIRQLLKDAAFVEETREKRIRFLCREREALRQKVEDERTDHGEAMAALRAQIERSLVAGFRAGMEVMR